MPTHIAGVLVLALGLATTVHAQPSFEFQTSIATPVQTPQAGFVVAYPPELVNGTRLASRAHQRLVLDAGRTGHWEAALTWLGTRRLGAQVTVSRGAVSLSGPVSSQDVELQYLSRQPPDYVEREYTYARAIDGAEPQGRVVDWRLAANAVWRPLRGAVDLTVTGGLAASRRSGWIDQFSFYEFRLGGHSTLFYEDAQVRLRLDDSWRMGLGAGLELGVRVGARLSVTAGMRMRSGGGRIPVRLDILNADSLAFPIPPDRIAASLDHHAVTLTRWGRPMLAIGLRYR